MLDRERLSDRIMDAIEEYLRDHPADHPLRVSDAAQAVLTKAHPDTAPADALELVIARAAITRGLAVEFDDGREWSE